MRRVGDRGAAGGPGGLNGKELIREIEPLAKSLGWKVARFPPVKTATGWRIGVTSDSKGWPDLFMVRDRIIAVEVKGEKDRFRGGDQQDWLTALKMVNSAKVEVCVWEPDDWTSGLIRQALERRETPAREQHDLQLSLTSVVLPG